MTANELADALDWVCENHLVGFGDADFKATAIMLRQQQAEIEALKAKTLTDEEIGDFTHRMVLCCQVHPSSADINVLGLKFIVEDILRKAQEK